MDFEYDPRKSASNKVKHNIDFEEAKEIWNDDDAYIASVLPRGEPRYIVVGSIDDVHWTAVITYRGETIRIISVRRSWPKEVEMYDNHKRIRREI